MEYIYIYDGGRTGTYSFAGLLIAVNLTLRITIDKAYHGSLYVSACLKCLRRNLSVKGA